MKKKILVLGSTGMLGSMVYEYFSKHSNYKVVGTVRKNTLSNIKHKKNPLYSKNADIHIFDAYDFLENQQRGDFLKRFHYIINCIGIIKPYCKDDDPKGVFNAICINSLFPHRLSRFLGSSKTKVIQIATDCVYSGKMGGYKEDVSHDALDVYGKTKSLGEVISGNLLNIRCSVVGPDDFKKMSLLEWLFGHKEGSTITGFTHHKWNGVTTLQFTQLCKTIIERDIFNKLRKTSHVYHYLPNKSVSKYQLLKIFTKVFERDYKIEKVSTIGMPIDRTLSTKFSSLKPINKIDIKDAIKELRNYMLKNKFL